MVAKSNGKVSFDLLAGFSGGEAITKSDTVDGTAEFSQFSRAIWVGGAGNIVVLLTSGMTVTLNSVAAGTLVPLQAKQVLSTSTTATNMVALW